jgi:hypothetical protein
MSSPADPNLDPGAIATRGRRLRTGAMFAFVLLAVQNALGIYLNLYVSVNDPSEYAGVFPAMFASLSGALHTAVALVLFLGAVSMVVVAWPSRDSMLRSLTVVALLSFLVAAYFGYHFVASGDPFDSFAMEMGFLAVILTEAALLLVLPSRGGAAGAPARAPRTSVSPDSG